MLGIVLSSGGLKTGRWLLALPLALCCLMAGSVAAAPIVIPLGLNPGDTYRLAFVTSSLRDATSSDIEDYNLFVTNVANSVTELAALGTSWRAIGSTADIDARDNTGTNPLIDAGVAIYSLDGTDLIASDNTDLWDGVLASPIRESENGEIEIQFAGTWTGTWIDGTGLAGATLGTTFVSAGFSNFPTAPWIAAEGRPPEDLLHLYAISGVLTVESTEIPEPSQLLLMVFGIIGIGYQRRRHGVCEPL